MGHVVPWCSNRCGIEINWKIKEDKLYTGRFLLKVFLITMLSLGVISLVTATSSSYASDNLLYEHMPYKSDIKLEVDNVREVIPVSKGSESNYKDNENLKSMKELVTMYASKKLIFGCPKCHVVSQVYQNKVVFKVPWPRFKRHIT